MKLSYDRENRFPESNPRAANVSHILRTMPYQSSEGHLAGTAVSSRTAVSAAR